MRIDYIIGIGTGFIYVLLLTIVSTIGTIFLLINAPGAMQNIDRESLFSKAKCQSNFLYVCVLEIVMRKY